MGDRLPNDWIPAGSDTAWWAGGLGLQDRLGPSGTTAGEFWPSPPAPVAAEEVPERARRRLDRWRSDLDTTRVGAFEHRLAASGITTGALLGLLAEPAGSLAARIGRPRWAEQIEQILAGTTKLAEAEPAGAEWSAGAGTNDSGDGVPAESGWLDRLGVPLRPFVAWAEQRLAGRVSGHRDPGLVDLDAIVGDFGAQLSTQLARVAARTLVLELNVSRVRGQLTGSTPRERFARFCGRLAGQPALARLLGEYPVLARLLAQTCKNAVDANAELLLRFFDDRAAIVGGLLGSADPGTLVGLRAGAGDRHELGRSCTLLRFADGRRVVYQPRPVDLHRHFNQVLGWFDGGDTRVAAALARRGYGWLEFVPELPCADIDAVDRFYDRLGALLALLHALNATDMHCENLIACADQPVLVDVETLFHPDPQTPEGLGADPAAAVLASSVQRTALLPRLLVGERGALDLSGLGGDPGAWLPDLVLGCDDPETDRMHLVRAPASYAGARNRPRLDGRVVDPAEHREALLAGFRRGYRSIVCRRDALVRMLGRFAADEIRVVARPTLWYARLLDESTHPDLLRDGLDRDRVLDSLWPVSGDDPMLSRLLPDEIDALWAGDVPRYTSRVASRVLRGRHGRRLPYRLPVAGLPAVTEKIMTRLGEEDLHEQEQIIEATLATRVTRDEHRRAARTSGPAAVTAPDPQRMLTLACGIADQIAVRAAHGEGRVNWWGLELVDDACWSVLPMGAGLADGYSGVALFLAQLSRLAGVARYGELARACMSPVPLLLEQLAERPDLAGTVGVGGMGGLAGICYCLARLVALTGDSTYLAWLSQAVELVPVALDGDPPPGVRDGMAGCLAAMAAIHTAAGLAGARALAFSTADRLVDLVERTGGRCCDPEAELPAGFAAGAGGVGWALLRFAGGTGAGRRYLDAGLLALRSARPEGGCPGWCVGDAGLVMAYADGLAKVGRPASAEYGPRLRRWIRRLRHQPPLQDLSLCHGDLGVAEALLVLAERDQDLCEPRTGRTGPQPGPNRCALVLAELERRGPVCGTPGGVCTPGLLSGLAGIGYGTLRLAFPQLVPSVLLLEMDRGSGEQRPALASIDREDDRSQGEEDERRRAGADLER